MTTGMTAAVVIGAVAVIGTGYALDKRGVISGKAQDQTPAGSAKS